MFDFFSSLILFGRFGLLVAVFPEVVVPFLWLVVLIRVFLGLEFVLRVFLLKVSFVSAAVYSSVSFIRFIFSGVPIAVTRSVTPRALPAWFYELTYVLPF